MSNDPNNTTEPANSNPLEFRDSSGLTPNSDLSSPKMLRAITDAAVKRGTMTEQQAVESLNAHGIEAEIDTRTDAQREWDSMHPERNAADYRFGELTQLLPDASHAELKGAHHTFAEFSAALRLAPTAAKDFLKNAVKAAQAIQETPEDQRENHLRNERQTLGTLFDNPAEVLDTVNAYLDAFPGESATKLRESGAFSNAGVVAKLYWRIKRLQGRPK